MVSGDVSTGGDGQGTGAAGTVTAIAVNGKTYEPTAGIVTIPDYPTSLTWSVIEGRPTHLSDFTDDVVSGKYQPLSSAINTSNIGNQSVKYATTAGSAPASDVSAWAKKSSLAASDVPNLDWSKITSGKPTTLSGYGITDAYTKAIIDGRLETLSARDTFDLLYADAIFSDVVNAESFIGPLIGNADTATKLLTARTIWGQSFDGSGNVSGAFSGATTGSFSSNVNVGGNLVVSGDVSTGGDGGGSSSGGSGDSLCLGPVELDMQSISSLGTFTQAQMDGFGLTTTVISNMLAGLYTKVIDWGGGDVYDYNGFGVIGSIIRLYFRQGNGESVDYTFTLYYDKTKWTITEN